jgi:hypothetical protein
LSDEARLPDAGTRVISLVMEDDVKFNLESLLSTARDALALDSEDPDWDLF